MASRDFEAAEAPGLRTAVWRGKNGSVLGVNSQGASVEGWLKGDLSKVLRERLYEFIREQTEQTQKTVQSFVTPRHARGTAGYRMKRGDPGPGFTRKHIEGRYYDDTAAAAVQHGSLYGKVRLEQDLVREPGGEAYDARRRPYIAAAVLNSGRYGGRKVTKVRVTASGARVRKYWEPGARRGANKQKRIKGQAGLRFWYLAHRAQRPKFEAAANRVLRGLDN